MASTNTAAAGKKQQAPPVPKAAAPKEGPQGPLDEDDIEEKLYRLDQVHLQASLPRQSGNLAIDPMLSSPAPRRPCHIFSDLLMLQLRRLRSALPRMLEPLIVQQSSRKSFRCRACSLLPCCRLSVPLAPCSLFPFFPGGWQALVSPSLPRRGLPQPTDSLTLSIQPRLSSPPTCSPSKTRTRKLRPSKKPSRARRPTGHSPRVAPATRAASGCGMRLSIRIGPTPIESGVVYLEFAAGCGGWIPGVWELDLGR